jgi:hypothetical protein
MDTQLAFAFGMLAMTTITMLVVLVVGMVKVIKLEKRVENLEQAISREVEMMHRHIADIERGIYSELGNIKDKFDRYTEDLKRELQAYTDSRADKLEQKLTNKKQLLKD